jgi:hypothetical protein
VAEPDEPFDPGRHRNLDAKSTPPANATVAETVGTGYTFRGKLLRPALVRLHEANTTAATDGEASAPAQSPLLESKSDRLSLSSSD